MILELMLERVTEGGEPTGAGRLIIFERETPGGPKCVGDIAEFDRSESSLAVFVLSERWGTLPSTAQYGSYDYECDEISLGEMIECLLGSDPAELDRERETEAFLGSGI